MVSSGSRLSCSGKRPAAHLHGRYAALARLVIRIHRQRTVRLAHAAHAVAEQPSNEVLQLHFGARLLCRSGHRAVAAMSLVTAATWVPGRLMPPEQYLHVSHTCEFKWELIWGAACICACLYSCAANLVTATVRPGLQSWKRWKKARCLRFMFCFVLSCTGGTGCCRQHVRSGCSRLQQDCG